MEPIWIIGASHPVSDRLDKLHQIFGFRDAQITQLFRVALWRDEHGPFATLPHVDEGNGVG
jgi:hypothetical protein